MRRVIFNQKGGVGKSSITANLAAISASKGLKTLVVDLDTQANTTQYLLGVPATDLECSIANLFEQSISFSIFAKEPFDFVHETDYPNLFVLPSHPELEHLESKLESRYKIFKLRDALEKLESEGFDEIYIDTPPALNFYTRSALIAANRCLIPFDCDDFSRQALYSLLNTLQEIREDHNDGLEVEGIVANQFQPRANLPQQLLKELVEEGLPVLPVFLSSSVKMRESHQQSAPLIHMAASHKLTQQFVELFDYIDESAKSKKKSTKAKKRGSAKSTTKKGSKAV